MRHVAAILFLILLCVDGWGCSAEPSERDAWCDAHQCDLAPLALAPVQGGTNVTPAAIQRLRDATGLDFIEDDYGVPVRFVEVLSHPERAGACGTTEVVFVEETSEVLSADIEIVLPAPPGCGPAWATLLHESIHAFAPGSPHTESGGIFDLHANGSVRIDDAARALLCDGRIGVCD